MLRYPMHGFAKRVDNSVERAMTYLQNREDFTATGRSSSLPKPTRKIRKHSLDE